MKKFVHLSVVFTSIMMLLFSCIKIGGHKNEEVSTQYNKTGELILKTPTDFEKKFGYQTQIILKKEKPQKFVEVFISKDTWNELAIPNDTTVVYIFYIENITYGKKNSSGAGVIYQQFNICTGYKVHYYHR